MKIDVGSEMLERFSWMYTIVAYGYVFGKVINSLLAGTRKQSISFMSAEV